MVEEAINDEREARREAEEERKRMRERKRGATEKAYAWKISVAREIGRSKERRRERMGRGRDEEGESGREKKRRKRGRGSPLYREKERSDGIIFCRHYFSLLRAEEGCEKRERTKRDESSPCSSLATEVISIARRCEEREGEKQRRRKRTWERERESGRKVMENYFET